MSKSIRIGSCLFVGCVFTAAVWLTACTPADQQRAATVATAAAPLVSLAVSSNARVASIAAVVCRYDAVAQPLVVTLGAPIAAVVMPGATAGIAGAVALDQGVIHPAVAAACPVGAVAVGGVPVEALNGVR